MDNSLNLSDIPDSLKGEMLKVKIEFSKKMSRIASESRKDAKTGKCLYCSNETNSYCNSHSIPASFLRNIADDGKLHTHAGLIDLPLLKDDAGINKAGTFHIICRDCDSKIFKDYEDKSNYGESPTQKMLAQIAMKNYLKSIGQRAYEISFNNSAEEEISFDFSNINKIKDSDLKENIQGFKRAKKIDAKCLKDEYYLFLNEKLDYVVPMAFQSQIALAVDLKGGVINNLYNHDSKYKIKMAHIAIFPLENYSVVMMFVDQKDKRYRAFIKQLNRLETAEKLEIINYIVFLYSEDFFLSKKIREGVITDEKLKNISGKTGISTIDINGNILEVLRKNYDLSNVKSIPNLLSREYSIT